MPNKKSSNQNLFLEPDRDRLVRRIAAVTDGDLTTDQIKSVVVDGDVDLLKDLSATSKQKVATLVAPDKRGVLEKVIGETIDFVPVSFIERAWVSAKAVARIIDKHRRPLGTGVMVSPRLMMTNNHVIADAQAASAASAQFDYQLALDDVAEAVTEFRFDPAAFFWTSPVEELDVALIAVGPRMTGEKPLERFGWTALSSAQDKHAEGDHVTIIEHPEGDYKQIALRENRVIGRGKKGVTLYYATDTLGGSSGSPVFNDDFELVALHHAGGHRNDDTLDDGRPVPDDCNEGIRISAIVDALRKRHDELPEVFRNPLAEALNPPAAATPLEKVAFESAAVSTETVTVSPVADIPTLVTADLHLPRLRISDRVVPTEIVENLLTPTSPGPDAVVAVDAAAILERNDAPDEHYAKRKGYDADFLSVSVAVPTVPAALLAKCAVPKGLQRSAATVLLPYNRFSLVVRADRRMPLFTIVNIDGRRLRSINRKTGEVETTETWYQDPRLAADDQLEQPIFDAQHPRIFDRGHMVRRIDPAWGSPPTAKAASDDTFHFTNCCPQILAFNQHLWQGIEDYARVNAGAEKLRITVITGPVFGKTDPTYRGIKVPREFWKIVVRVSDIDAKLRATGLLADQNDGLAKAFGDGNEAFTDIGKVVTYQKSIAAIEKLSGLSFNGLAAHDTLKVGLEAAAPELDSLDEVTW
ncbi:hypothetical protein DVS77_04860 [Mycolicibacterium moriokaense]|nr:hypothetical protein DVS77_04860 [Mycolicibacterium moriokaense]